MITVCLESEQLKRKIIQPFFFWQRNILTLLIGTHDPPTTSLLPALAVVEAISIIGFCKISIYFHIRHLLYGLHTVPEKHFISLSKISEKNKMSQNHLIDVLLKGTKRSKIYDYVVPLPMAS